MTARRSPTPIDYQAKCEAPAEEFARFARSLQRSKRALGALTSSPAADPFAKRLIADALSGQAQAAACLAVVGQLVEDGDWRDKLRAAAVTADLPTPNQVKAKDIEALGKVLLNLLEEEIALAWIAFAYLSMKGAARLRSAVERLLLEGAPTSDALLDALSRGVAAVEATTNPVPKIVISRAITAVERYAETRSSGAEETATPDLAIITARASRAELARLVAAFLSLQDAGGAGPRPVCPNCANGEAAWVLADKDLARALQGAAALTHALDLATNVDDKVRGYAEIIAQAVESVAAKRELELQGVVGETAEYDPAVHQDDIDSHAPSLVRIRRPAVVQGKEDYSRIIRKAEIEPA
jgi:hypothetical protein